MGFLVTSPRRIPYDGGTFMQHSFFQKLILAILAGLLAAGLYEFYREFVVGSMTSVNGKHRLPGQERAATATPRRY